MWDERSTGLGERVVLYAGSFDSTRRRAVQTIPCEFSINILALLTVGVAGSSHGARSC